MLSLITCTPCEPRNNLVECQIGLSSHQIEQPPLDSGTQR